MAFEGYKKQANNVNEVFFEGRLSNIIESTSNSFVNFVLFKLYLVFNIL